MLIIDIEAARRFILSKQGLWPGRHWSGNKGTGQAIRAMEYLKETKRMPIRNFLQACIVFTTTVIASLQEQDLNQPWPPCAPASYLTSTGFLLLHRHCVDHSVGYSHNRLNRMLAIIFESITTPCKRRITDSVKTANLAMTHDPQKRWQKVTIARTANRCRHSQPVSSLTIGSAITCAFGSQR